MSFFTRRGRRERDTPPGPAGPRRASTFANGVSGGLSEPPTSDREPGSLFLAYLCPMGEAPASSTPFVKLQVNAQDMTSLVTRACKAPPLTALDELSGCFYDIRFTSSSEPGELVACATFSRRNEI
jgi:hypothetical protein